MSVTIMAHVWEESKQTDNMRLALLAIADNAHDDGLAWPGLEYLQRKILKSESQTRRLLQRLATTPELYEGRAVGRGNKNLYFVMVGLSREVIERTLVEQFGIAKEKVSSEVDAILARPEKGISNSGKKVSSEGLKGVIVERESPTTQNHNTEPDQDSDRSFTNVHDLSGATPSDPLGTEIDAIKSKPLEALKLMRAALTLSKPSESERKDVPRRCPIQECNGELDDQLHCPICNRRYRHDSIAPGALALLYTPGEVVMQGRGKVAIVDEKGNLVKPVTDFYVILPDVAYGPFPSKGKGPSAEVDRIASATGGRVSQSPEGRSVEAPPAKAQKPKPPRPRNPLLDAVALWCYGNVDAAFKMRGVPASLNRALGEIKAATPDVTPEQIVKAQQWWNANDWRGQKGQRPEPHQVPAAWLKFMNGDVVNGTNGNADANGHKVLDGGGGPDRGAAETDKFWR